MDVNFMMDTPSNKNSDGSIDRFSEDLANSICKMYTCMKNEPGSFVVALEGEWGAGKSTILNLLINKLDKIELASSVTVVKFNPWNFSTSEDLVRKFFDELLLKMGKDGRFGEEFLKKIKKYAGILSYSSIIPQLSFASKFSSDLEGLIDKITKETGSLEETKREVNEALECQQLLVLIDDIDRLLPNQILQIFQLVKSTGDLTNIIYLLAFDKVAVCHHLKSAQIISPEKYLDKIIQVTVQVPRLPKTYIRRYVLDQLDKLGITYKWNNNQYLSSVFSLIGDDNAFGNIRAVKKFFNTLMFEYNLVKGSIDDGDFIAITYIKVFYNDIYMEIFRNVRTLTGKYKKIDSVEISASLEGNELLKNLFVGMFPIARTNYNYEKYRNEYEDGKGIWSENNFHRYFNLRPITLDDDLSSRILQSKTLEDLQNEILKFDQSDWGLIKLLDMKADCIDERNLASFLEFLFLNWDEIRSKKMVRDINIEENLRKLIRKVKNNDPLAANEFLITVLKGIPKKTKWTENVKVLRLIQDLYSSRDSKQGIENKVYHLFVEIADRLINELKDHETPLLITGLKEMLEFLEKALTPKITIEIVDNILSATIDSCNEMEPSELQEGLKRVELFIGERPIIAQDSNVKQKIQTLKGMFLTASSLNDIGLKR